MQKKSQKKIVKKNCNKKLQTNAKNAPYKKRFEKIGDFDGGSYKTHFRDWQFDVSLLKNFRKMLGGVFGVPAKGAHFRVA